jgi:hypothetical protein
MQHRKCTLQPLKMKALCLFEFSQNIHTVIKRHIADSTIPQKHHCGKSICRNIVDVLIGCWGPLLLLMERDVLKMCAIFAAKVFCQERCRLISNLDDMKTHTSKYTSFFLSLTSVYLIIVGVECYFWIWSHSRTYTHTNKHTHTHTDSVVVDEKSGRLRDMCMTTHNSHKRRTYPLRDSNPQSQETDGVRPTP